MFLALKITQAVLKYNGIHWTIPWKDNSVQWGYSSSSCTQRIERNCRRFSILYIGSADLFFSSSNNLTWKIFHLNIEISSLKSLEQTKGTIEQSKVWGSKMLVISGSGSLISFTCGTDKTETEIKTDFSFLFSTFPQARP